MKTLQELLLYNQLNIKGKIIIDKIYVRSMNDYYSKSTWPNWIDHGKIHIDNVLNNLDNLIPNWVLPKIGNDEALLLLSSATLHDIGMVPTNLPPMNKLHLNNNIQKLYNRFNEIRKNHGILGSNLCRRYFREIISDNDLLDRICDIIENHCVDFKPKQTLINQRYRHYVSDALLVRMADGIDFGENRAPSWLFDIINPTGEQEKYWLLHRDIESPTIDNKFLRIHIRGKIKDDDFIISLKQDFHEHIDVQNEFFSRGLKDALCFYIISDETTKTKNAGEESIKECRPTIFSKENYLLAARYLYNIGQYEAAMNAFKDGMTNLSNKWSETPGKYYFYHFLQTHNKLGKYSETINLINKLKIEDFAENEKAAILIAKGIANLKLRKRDESLQCFEEARRLYDSNRDKNLINIADTYVWESIIEIEKLREKLSNMKFNNSKTLVENIKLAKKFYTEYEKNNNKNIEVHYKGRYFGLLAFYNLFHIENNNEFRKSQLYIDALVNATKAYGGKKTVSRVPFGIMSGKYAEAVVYLFKYQKYEKIIEDLFLSAKSFSEVLKSYKVIYGNNKISYTIEKIEALAKIIVDSLKSSNNEDSSQYKELLNLCKDVSINLNNSENEIEIFTPLN